MACSKVSFTFSLSIWRNLYKSVVSKYRNLWTYFGFRIFLSGYEMLWKWKCLYSLLFCIFHCRFFLFHVHKTQYTLVTVPIQERLQDSDRVPVWSEEFYSRTRKTVHCTQLLRTLDTKSIAYKWLCFTLSESGEIQYDILQIFQWMVKSVS